MTSACPTRSWTRSIKFFVLSSMPDTGATMSPVTLVRICPTARSTATFRISSRPGNRGERIDRGPDDRQKRREHRSELRHDIREGLRDGGEAGFGQLKKGAERPAEREKLRGEDPLSHVRPSRRRRTSLPSAPRTLSGPAGRTAALSGSPNTESTPLVEKRRVAPSTVPVGLSGMAIGSHAAGGNRARTPIARYWLRYF